MKEKKEKVIVPGYRQFGGKHCQTTALKNLLEYHGLHLSEEMLLGLGGGIGFIYWYMKWMPTPFIRTKYGKGTEPIIKTCERIGAKATVVETGSAKKGCEDLKNPEEILVHIKNRILECLEIEKETFQKLGNIIC